MAHTRRHRGTAQLMDAAGHALSQATRQLLEATPIAGDLPHDHLRAIGWNLVQITGELAELSTTLALRLDEHARTRLVRTVDGEDPSRDLARAARQLTELRRALDHADAAARDYYICLSHLVVDADPTTTAESTPRNPSVPRPGRHGRQT